MLIYVSEPTPYWRTTVTPFVPVDTGVPSHLFQNVFRNNPNKKPGTSSRPPVDGTTVRPYRSTNPTTTPLVSTLTTTVVPTTACLGGDSCCSPASQCGEGQGDCDGDDDCSGELVCVSDACDKSTFPSFDSSDDCCMWPNTSITPTTTTAMPTAVHLTLINFQYP